MLINVSILLKWLDTEQTISSQVIYHFKDRDISIISNTSKSLNSSSQSSGPSNSSAAMNCYQFLILYFFNTLLNDLPKYFMAFFSLGLLHIAPAHPLDINKIYMNMFNLFDSFLSFHNEYCSDQIRRNFFGWFAFNSKFEMIQFELLIFWRPIFFSLYLLTINITPRILSSSAQSIKILFTPKWYRAHQKWEIVALSGACAKIA